MTTPWCDDCDGPCAGPTAEVVVSEPCACEPCTDGARWFYCRELETREIARYGCHGFDGMPDVPHPDAVRKIMGLHPGKRYRFLDIGVSQHVPELPKRVACAR